MIRVGIIGSGNIVRTRHLPALRTLRHLARVVGISDTHADRAGELARAFSIPRFDSNKPDSIEAISWMAGVDALVVATPPPTHGTLVNQALALNKHVLVEKPFVVDLAQGVSAIAAAQERGLVLAVNHNFQFSRGFTKLGDALLHNRLGELRGVYSLQLSNDARRLPAWSETLPLGLFYDESPHVFYLLAAFADAFPCLVSSYMLHASNGTRTTPHLLSLELNAGTLPGSIHIDFESPICEWVFAVLGDRGIGFVDLFRDIYTYLPNDGQHLMREVLTSSGLATVQHWRGFVQNGWSYLRSSLLYGFDTIYRNFFSAINTSDPSVVARHSGSVGLQVNQLQYDVVAAARQPQA